MSAVASLIADMVRAGVDPELIGRTAELLANDDQAERRRAADRERKRVARASTMSAESADAPHPPALDKETPPAPPKEIKPTPLTPQTTLQNASANGGKSDLESLTYRLLEAAGEKIQPHGAIVLAPIIGLLEAGCDLETDILPTIRARAAKLTRPAGSWGYFVAAIREAYEKRIEAGRGLSKPKERKGWMDGLSPDEQREKWRKTVSIAHLTESWKSWLWGPPPGQAGCLVPADLLTTRDLNHHWYEEKAPEVA